MTRRPGMPVGNGHVILREPTAHRPYYRLDYRDQDGARHDRPTSVSPADGGAARESDGSPKREQRRASGRPSRLP